MRLLKDFIKKWLRKYGYEIYRRPYLPKGVDPYESLRALWPAWQPKVIFDVGANAGQTVAKLRPMFASAKIHAFEPVPTTFEILQRATIADALTSLHCLALGDRDGEQWIHLHANSDMNSLNPALIAEVKKDSAPVRLQVSTLDSFCASAAVSHIDLLKIDVEGFELQVLAGATKSLGAAAIDFLVVEAGLMPGAARFTPLPALLEALRPQGFWLVGIYEQYGWRHAQTAEFCNAVFAHERMLRP